MERELNLVMYGPCSEESEAKPKLGDTVGAIGEDGRVRFMSITGANATPDGMVLYAAGGERLMLSDCYLLYTSDTSSVE